MRSALLSAVPFQLVLVDHLLPGMSGEELAGLLRQDPQLSEVPLVLLTSAGIRGDGRRYEEAGFSAYLTKPVRSDILRQTLAAVLGTQRQGSPAGLITRHSVEESRRHSVDQPPHFKGRVLLAEDIPANQKVAVSMLKKLGLAADVATNGTEAVEKAGQCQYDLIFMDCQMPELDGYGATEQIRGLERERGGHVPIIALTANAMGSAREKCLEAGMDDYIAKPFERDDLVMALLQWLPATGDGLAKKMGSGELPAASASRQSGVSALDEGKLNAMREILADDFPEMLCSYLDGAESMLEQLPPAVEASDSKEVERLAHSLKSSSLHVGAVNFSELARELEDRARNGQLDDVRARIRALEGEFQRVRGALQCLTPTSGQ
jgi:CheY-like chemotaxis protein/HPt (histidine-containing phosphotransfer) domain-containing protein